jgi:exodeoxyribonuclease VII large subunit
MPQRPLFEVTGENPVFSVSEFLDFVNEVLGARDVSVQGEIVGAKPHPTGFYFSVKDTTGQPALMDCYLSPHAYRGLGFALEDGMVVRLGGIASIYKAKGRFSFRVETVALAGEGSLKKAYEALKKKLTDEGLFERKRPLPQFVRRVALITSRTGAVIDDFRRNLAHLGLRVTHADVRVEGAQAPGQIRSALEHFNAHAADYDVLVLIRGGGSMEDLQPFNDEYVVRAVFGSRIPTVVSIGHDRDVPLAQMAADASASTPTATAHLINATWDRLLQVPMLWQRITAAYEAMCAAAGADVRASAHRIAVQLARLAGRGREYGHKVQQMLERVGQRIAVIREQLASAERHLAASSPERLLRLGYSIVADESGAVIRSSSQLRHGQAVTTQLARGAFISEVKELQSE